MEAHRWNIYALFQVMLSGSDRWCKRRRHASGDADRLQTITFHGRRCTALTVRPSGSSGRERGVLSSLGKPVGGVSGTAEVSPPHYRQR